MNEWSDERRQCLFEAAASLGAPPDAARQFSDTGSTVLEGHLLQVLPLGGSRSGPWIASMTLDRPAGVLEATWYDALLTANSHALLADDWGFGLGDESSAALVLQLPIEPEDARLLAARFEGMLSMCRAVEAGVTHEEPAHA